MDSTGTPMLFAPPLPPIQLPIHMPLVIGRSRECDLRLPDPDTSRRHAELHFEEARFVVQDLASTNGTFVNGERVERCALRPGDRLQIGAHQITFCQVQGGLELPGEEDEANTQLFERPVRADAFRGDLAQIPPFAVLQILELGRKSGGLQIESETLRGQLWLEGGEPIHAETASQTGFGAALSLIAASAGRFVFTPALALPERTIEASVTELLLESARRLDEELGASVDATPPG